MTVKGKSGSPWPWWLTLMCAAALYTGLKYLLPALELNNPFLREMVELGLLLAPILTILLLLLAAKQLYDIPAAEQEDGDRQPEEEQPENQ